MDKKINMKNNKYLQIYSCLFMIFVLIQNVSANDNIQLPDISGEWVALNENGEETETIIAFSQSGKNLEGTFVDSKDGNIIIEAPITGYIDIKGNVIFDVYFGRVTSTNRLKLSADHNALNGKFTNNMENDGEVNLLRK
jgi:flagellar hook assembly protein FlgD